MKYVVVVLVCFAIFITYVLIGAVQGQISPQLIPPVGEED